jgi:S-adenosylmethionine hydrolase
MPTPLITLTTDFGLADSFVGVMKGVILSITPEARIVDLCHGLPPGPGPAGTGDLRAAAFVLLSGAGYFPPGTIHVAVVDPTVGTSRRIICVSAASHTFLAPDNGILSWVTARSASRKVFNVIRTDLSLSPLSSTFHGRDVFAPIAARLAAGLPPDALGPQISDMLELAWPRPEIGPQGDLAGEILYVDAFGNLITNIEPDMLARFGQDPIVIRAGLHTISGISAAYAAVRPGRLLALVGSAGFLEIAVRAGSASRVTELAVGAKITISPGDII